MSSELKIRGTRNQISDGSVSAGNWYHIVGSYDGTYQKLYVDALSPEEVEALFNQVGL